MIKTLTNSTQQHEVLYRVTQSPDTDESVTDSDGSVSDSDVSDITSTSEADVTAVSAEDAAFPGRRRAWDFDGSDTDAMADSCLEPGLLAVDVKGPLIATVDMLGNVMLRDFNAGRPCEWSMQQFLAQHGCYADGHVDAGCALVPCDTSDRNTSAAADIATLGSLQLDSAAGNHCGVTVENDRETQDLSHLKFWRRD